jgi:hypothetical protein
LVWVTPVLSPPCRKVLSPPCSKVPRLSRAFTVTSNLGKNSLKTRWKLVLTHQSARSSLLPDRRFQKQRWAPKLRIAA